MSITTATVNFKTNFIIFCFTFIFISRKIAAYNNALINVEMVQSQWGVWEWRPSRRRHRGSGGGAPSTGRLLHFI